MRKPIYSYILLQEIVDSHPLDCLVHIFPGVKLDDQIVYALLQRLPMAPKMPTEFLLSIRFVTINSSSTRFDLPPLSIFKARIIAPLV